jgi:hypothetical protein
MKTQPQYARRNRRSTPVKHMVSKVAIFMADKGNSIFANLMSACMQACIHVEKLYVRAADLV